MRNDSQIHDTAKSISREAAGSKKSATREKLEQAAIALFAKHGIEGGSTRDIASLAGFAEGTLYRHYASKEEMAQSIFIRHYLDLGDRFDRALGAHDDTDSAMHAMVVEAYSLFDHKPDLFAFLIRYQHRFLDSIGDDERTPVRVLRDLVLRAGGRHSSPVDAEKLSMVLGIILQPAVSAIYGDLEGAMAPRAGRVSEAAMRVLEL